MFIGIQPCGGTVALTLSRVAFLRFLHIVAYNSYDALVDPLMEI